MPLDHKYSLKNTTSSLYTSPDSEELDALVDIMRNLAEFCGMTVLTYSIRSGNLSMLVRTAPRETLLAKFQDAEGEVAGSGDNRLIEHLLQRYSEARIQKLMKNLTALRKSGEDTTERLERYTNRIGNPGKFAEGINEAFARWSKKNRPKTYKKLNGKICQLAIAQTQITDGEHLRTLAAGIDLQAVIEDEGATSRPYYCGYADALRGNQEALAGLQSLVGASIASEQNIQDLGYREWLEQIDNTVDLTKVSPITKKATIKAIENVPKSENSQKSIKQSSVKHSSVKNSSVKLREDQEAAPSTERDELSEPTTEEKQEKPAHQEVHETQDETAPIAVPIAPRSKGRRVMLSSIVVLLAILAAGAVVVIKKRQAKETAAQVLPGNTIAKNETTQGADKKARAKDRQLAYATTLLYGPEAAKLANDFAKSSDVEARLKMCRQPELIKTHLSDYPPQALNIPVKNILTGEVVNASGILFARFLAQFDDGTRLLCVVATPDGLKVDWDCYARYSTATWPQLLDNEVATAEVRVVARSENYYNFSYRDDEQWKCYLLWSSDMGEQVYGYVRRGSDAARTLRTLPVQEWQRVTLKITGTGEGVARRQFTIEQALAIDWVKRTHDPEDSD